MKSADFAKGSEIFLDMDGVLCDFFEEYAKLAGNPKDGSGRYNYRNIPPAKTDPTLNKMVGTDFFARLPKFPTTDALITMVLKKFPHYNICSSPLRGDYENSEKHKKIWLKNNLRVQPNRVIITPRKEKYAVQPDGTPNILIDDRGSNITAWEAAGGIGIKYQADENDLYTVARGLDRAEKIIKKEMEHDKQVLVSKDRSMPVAVPDKPVNESVDIPLINRFIGYVSAKLDIPGPLPKMQFSNEKEGADQHRTGWYNADQNELWVYTGNRNLIDIMRTIAHELAHHKQRTQNETSANTDLAELESQADMAAGMIMKLWVRLHPEIIQ